MDQRKVNVLAREYCDDIKRKNKPIILSHHMLPGLLQGQEKMSKSNSSSAIFMEDEENQFLEHIRWASTRGLYDECHRGVTVYLQLLCNVHVVKGELVRWDMTITHCDVTY
ncbi:hypothetical protein L6452_28486 [Arctium lappa]|uniref:Uncharacterized protein n=1 Tax=Arctium lappa TaxID=4217 RepID=A0ACB8ZXN8_ARCLA|nr:hypothetical protein L6452_28486 [Arctium lappa]